MKLKKPLLTLCFALQSMCFASTPTLEKVESDNFLIKKLENEKRELIEKNIKKRKKIKKLKKGIASLEKDKKLSDVLVDLTYSNAHLSTNLSTLIASTETHNANQVKILTKETSWWENRYYIGAGALVGIAATAVCFAYLFLDKNKSNDNS